VQETRSPAQGLIDGLTEVFAERDGINVRPVGRHQRDLLPWNELTASTCNWPQLRNRLAVTSHHKTRTTFNRSHYFSVLIPQLALCDRPTHTAQCSKQRYTLLRQFCHTLVFRSRKPAESSRWTPGWRPLPSTVGSCVGVGASVASRRARRSRSASSMTAVSVRPVCWASALASARSRSSRVIVVRTHQSIIPSHQYARLAEYGLSAASERSR
jgi:hypothetical protein